MKAFKDLKIQPVEAGFIGDKIKISKILNKQIVVCGYKIGDSQFDKKNGPGKYLTIQIEYENEKRVIFTGSTGLLQAIEQIQTQDMPFTTTIVEDNDRYEFT